MNLHVDCMTRLDWDRVAREQRMRRRGSVSAWVDEIRLDPDQELEVLRLLRAQLDAVSQFERLDSRDRFLWGSPTRERLRALKKAAEAAVARDEPRAADVVTILRYRH